MSRSTLRLRRPFEDPTQPARQLGVVGLPDPLTDREPAQVDRLAAEPQLDAAREAGLRLGAPSMRSRSAEADDLIDAAALLGAADRVVAVEDQAVARLDRRARR